MATDRFHSGSCVRLGPFQQVPGKSISQVN